jgi:predicted glycosyltransferase
VHRRTDPLRVLIYSHDTFGLGHLRRCRTIAQSLVKRCKRLSVLILSGSPIIGSFDFRSRVDFVRIPGVIKLRNGEYSSLNLRLDLHEVLKLRASIIRHSAEAFRPDLFLVDKEPLGLRGEIQETLYALKEQGTSLVLGLRDVLDDPSYLAREWRRKNPTPALRDLYDAIWVYGLPQICEPLAGLALPPEVMSKLVYTGYLRTNLSAVTGAVPSCPVPEPYLLVTTGGGGDGEALIDWVLRAYESDPEISWSALLLLGPFMARRRRQQFRKRVARLPRVAALTFDTHAERLMAGAEGVVAMGGYNTFCEILSLDKPALVVPRMRPRREQYIRAARAERLGLIRMLSPEQARAPERMARALRALPKQERPSHVVIPGLLDGLDSIHNLFEHWVRRPPSERRPSVALQGL